MRKQRRMFRAVPAQPAADERAGKCSSQAGGHMDPAEKEFLLALYGKLWDNL